MPDDNEPEIHVCPVDSGEFVVARGGFWLPGVYADEAAGEHAATMTHEELNVIWLRYGRALHLIDGELRPAA